MEGITVVGDARPVIIATISNMLDPALSREIREAPPYRTVREYILDTWPLLPSERRLIVAIDGRLCSDTLSTLDIMLKPGQSALFALAPGKGGGKNILTTVAMVAFTIYTGGAGFGTFFANAAFDAGMIAMSSFQTAAMAFGIASAVIGGVVMSALTPSVQADTGGGYSSDLSSSATYSWDTKPNPVTEGVPVPFLYGTHRITPTRIGSYVELGSDGKQYLNLLYLVADHAVDSITDCEINGTPSANFSGVTIDTRLGALDQAVIQNFSDTISEKAAGYVLSTDWSTLRTDGNSVQGLGIMLVCDRLYYANGAGGLDNTSLTVEMEYRKVGDADWTPIDPLTISAASTSAVRRYSRIDNVSDGQYDVRVRRTSAESTDARRLDRCKFEGIQEIVYDDFRYPGTSLVSLRIQATDQLSGSLPSVTFLATRSTVPVWTGAAYEPKPANNPAWACWDLLHNEDYGGDVDCSRILYADFLAWAGWCESEGLTVNIYVDAATSFANAINMLSTLGRGTCPQAGSNFTCLVDMPVEIPAQGFLFTVGNVAKDSFTEEWLAMDGRANCIEITYFDSEVSYSRQVVELHSEDFDTSTREINRTAITLVGCTSRAQAIAHGQYLLNCNRYLTETVGFDADIDALGCMPGDVIDVQHDVPQWGYGGRIVSATADDVVLDTEVTLSPGKNYAITVKLADDTRLDADVAGVLTETTTDTLTIVGGWGGDTPEPDDLFSFGESGAVSKKFRIVTITRVSDQRRRVTALEYVPEVYEPGAPIPDPVDQSALAGVTGLAAVENLVIEDGAPISSVALSWRGVGLSWGVSYRKQGDSTWIPLATVQVPFHTAYGLTSDTSYEFKVQTGGESQTTSLDYVGLPVPPDVAGFVAVASADGLGTYKWAQVEFLILQGYELRYAARRDDETLDWDSATILTSVTKGTLITNAALPPGDWTVGVKAVATGGKYSAIAATSHISMGNSNALLAQEEQAPAWPGTVTDMVRHHTGVLVPESTVATADLGWELFDSFVASPVASCSYESPEIDLATDVGRARLWATAEAVLGPGETGSADPAFEVKYRAESGAYGEWSPWSVGVVPARYVKFRVVLVPTTGAAYLRDFVPTVDVAPQTETLGPVSVPAGGGSVAFAQEFYAVPKVFPQVVDATEALYPIPSSTTKIGCTMHVYNTSGASVGGTVVAQVTT